MSKPDIPAEAVILAAGMGSRLKPLTDTRPKPLVEVNGVPIIHNALEQLGAAGVRRATIVVGYRKDAIEYACGSSFAGVAIDYVASTVFDRTGSAYSLWLAREALLRGDVLLLEGDVFFEAEVLRKLLRSEAANSAAVAPFTPEMEGSAVTLSDLGLIVEVRTSQTAANLSGAASPLFKTMNLFRFNAQALAGRIVPALDELVRGGSTKAYTEQLLGQLIADKGLKVTAVRCDECRWYEIDSRDDLKIAEAMFAPGQKESRRELVGP